MLSAVRPPGVYFVPCDLRPREVEVLRTDITGFLGIAERGPLHNPQKIETVHQFQSVFGTRIAAGFLAYAVEAFFANGGLTCWVVRVADPERAKPASARLMNWNNQETLELTARHPGTGGRRISYTLARRGIDRFSLAFRLEGDQVEAWNDLSMSSSDDRYVEAIINDERRGSRLVIAKNLRAQSWLPDNVPALSPAARLNLVSGRLEGGADGLATLEPHHFTGESSPPGECWGLRTLEQIDEIAIVAIPDLMPKDHFSAEYKQPKWPCTVLNDSPHVPYEPPSDVEFPREFDDDELLRLQQHLIAHCAMMGDRFAVLDVPRHLLPPETPVEQIIAWRNHFQSEASRHGAIYYPWVKVRDDNHPDLFRNVPASAFVAGVYARVDLSVGVHKPPANELVELANDVSTFTNETNYAILNEYHINVIRPFVGRGIRVAGARTLALRGDLEWRFVNVRRLVTMIKEKIDEVSQPLVFDPNNIDLWVDIDRVIRGLLTKLWQRGMLDGATVDEAFTVLCNDTTNPPAETEAGRVLCEIRLLPPQPAEYVYLRIGRQDTLVDIREIARVEYGANA